MEENESSSTGKPTMAVFAYIFAVGAGVATGILWQTYERKIDSLELKLHAANIALADLKNSMSELQSESERNQNILRQPASKRMFLTPIFSVCAYYNY